MTYSPLRTFLNPGKLSHIDGKRVVRAGSLALGLGRFQIAGVIKFGALYWTHDSGTTYATDPRKAILEAYENAGIPLPC